MMLMLICFDCGCTIQSKTLKHTSLTSMSSWVKFSGSSPIMLARCRLPMLNSSTCFWMNSRVNFSGPAAARFFLRRPELTHIGLLRTWTGRKSRYFAMSDVSST